MSDAVQQIKDRLNIVDVVSQYVELHKAGKQFKGKSPFTNERTPSFYVSPDRGMYYCFSTNQGGDMFTFIQVMEGVEFKDALKVLAEKANVELVPEAPEKKGERERQYALLEAATEWFVAQYKNTPAAQEYLRARGVTDNTIATWRVGYAPGPPHGGWRELRSAMQDKGYTDVELFATGLIKRPSEGKDPFDVFRDRIMFPMSDSQGRVVAFSGRILHPNDKAPKYVNSPETALYKKSELLFGYDKAKQAIRSLPFWLISEGQFDVIMSHQAGYTNAVAVSGTALTLYHVQQLERLCTQVVLALDGDRAGIAAMQKAATLMLSRGFDVKVAALPEGSDPADLIMSGADTYKACVREATHIIEFLLEYLRKQSKDERAFKLRVREELLPFVVLIPNKIDQDHFMSIVAAATSTSVDAIRYEVVRLSEQGRSVEEEAAPAVREPEAAASETESHSRTVELVAYLQAAQKVVPAEWQTRMESLIDSEFGPQWPQLTEAVQEELVQQFAFHVEREFDSITPRQQAEELIDRINQLANAVVQDGLRNCRQALAAADRAGDTEAYTTHLESLQKWQKRKIRNLYTYTDILKESS